MLACARVHEVQERVGVLPSVKVAFGVNEVDSKVPFEAAGICDDVGTITPKPGDRVNHDHIELTPSRRTHQLFVLMPASGCAARLCFIHVELDQLPALLGAIRFNAFALRWD
jgi:hypothetical protein